MRSSVKFWLIFIFIFILSLRLWIVFQYSEISYDSYFIARQVEHISSEGVPLINDDLSYSGRINVVSPLYFYVLAFFDLFLPIVFVLKVIPSIFASLIVVVVFYLALLIVKDEKISLFVAFLSGLIPVFFNVTINNASSLSVAVPLFFLVTYYFLRTNQDSEYLYKLIVSMILLVLLSPVSIILVLAFVIYLVLLKIQNFRENAKEAEIVLFFTFFSLWVNLIIFKKALDIHGGEVVLQNIPKQIIDNSFYNITFIQSIYGIGLVALIFGLFAIYSGLFVSNKKTITFFMSICISFFLLLWFKLVELAVGLIFLGVSFTVLSSFSINSLFVSVSKLKIKNNTFWFSLIFILVVFILFIPNVIFAYSIAGNVPSKNDIDGFLWLKNNTEKNSVVLVLPFEGSAMSYFSERKNVMDDNYLLINNIDKRYDDVYKVYSDIFLTSALYKLNYYSVDYVMITEKNYLLYNISNLKYEGDCVSLVWSHPDADVPKIYKVNCILTKEQS